jgi:hypothetical protein
MAFCKKKVIVTIDLLDKLAEECKERFYKSDATQKSKQILKKVNPIFQIIRYPKWRIYGNAMAIGKYAKKDRCKRNLKLKCSNHPHLRLDGNDFFMVIQINVALGNFTRRGLRYLVAHELAHLLQIVEDEEVENQYSYSTDNDHSKRWATYCRQMGGNGEEFIELYHVWC